MAFVILHPQHAEKWKGKHREFEVDLKAHAKGRLPGFACPEWVEVVPELPVSHAFNPNFVDRSLEPLPCNRKHPPERF